MHRYQDTEKKNKKNTLYFKLADQQVYTNIGMLRPDPNQTLIVADNEATILFNFFMFLQKKRNDLIFNVPRGKMDLLEESRVKFFLALNGQNREKIADPLRAKGWRAFPFFVIDPYDRSSFPSIDAGLALGGPMLARF